MLDEAEPDEVVIAIPSAPGTLRARVVGEGANLAFTQRARIEYARRGGRINMDAIDNSAGVDTSDHEVNLKILLDRAVRAGTIDHAERDKLLAAVADDVAEGADAAERVQISQAISNWPSTSSPRQSITRPLIRIKVTRSRRSAPTRLPAITD